MGNMESAGKTYVPVLSQDRKTVQLVCQQGPDECLPVLVRRNHERWSPAYLLGRSGPNGQGGYRLMSFDPVQRTHRVRPGAEVVEIDAETHSKLVEQYRQFMEDCLGAISVQSQQRVRQSKGSKGKSRKVHDA